MNESNAPTKDPVCAMVVDPATALHAKCDGQDFYFCSAHCQQKFMSTPTVAVVDDSPPGRIHLHLPDDAANGIEAELLDGAGNPVPQGPLAAGIQSNSCAYLLPCGSRLDWLVSYGGISLMADAKDKYALMVGSRGWLIPIETAGTYSLRIRLRGLPWTSNLGHTDLTQSKLLLDLPPTRIQITKQSKLNKPRLGNPPLAAMSATLLVT